MPKLFFIIAAILPMAFQFLLRVDFRVNGRCNDMRITACLFFNILWFVWHVSSC